MQNYIFFGVISPENKNSYGFIILELAFYLQTLWVISHGIAPPCFYIYQEQTLGLTQVFIVFTRKRGGCNQQLHCWMQQNSAHWFFNCPFYCCLNFY